MDAEKEISLTVPKLILVIIVVATVSIIGGYYGSDMIEGSDGGTISSLSTSEIKTSVQDITDMQIQRQKMQLEMMAQQSENYTAEDFNIEANVGEPKKSEIEGLYRVPVNITSKTPSQQNPNEIQENTQSQELYVSSDGQYLFGRPTDIKKLKEQMSQPKQNLKVKQK